MRTGQITDVNARKDPIKAALLSGVDNHVLVVKVEEDLLIFVASVPNVGEDMLDDLCHKNQASLEM